MSKNFKVDQKNKTITIYRQSMTTKDYKRIEIYKGHYEFIILERKAPIANSNSKLNRNDLLKYLENNIDKKIYDEMKVKIQNKENFYDVKGWLKEELQKYAIDNNKEYIPFHKLIKKAKEEEEEKLNNAGNVKTTPPQETEEQEPQDTNPKELKNNKGKNSNKTETNTTGTGENENK